MIIRVATIIIFGIITSLQIKAQQNLISNGSFEEFWYCPPVIAQDTFPCKSWHSPNLGSPDYFHFDCMVNGVINSHEYLSPHSGNAYIGLGLISLENSWMEHIQSRLIEPLKARQKYKVTFWVCLDYKYSDYTAYNIGLIFSKNKKILGDYLLTKDNYITGMSPELQAHISNEKGKFLTDTTWAEISGIYTAEGGEEYVTIGMFWDDNPKVVKAWQKAKEKQAWSNNKRFAKALNKHLLKKNIYMENKYLNFPNKGNQHYPYYIIDNVSVVPIDW